MKQVKKVNKTLLQLLKHKRRFPIKQLLMNGYTSPRQQSQNSLVQNNVKNITNGCYLHTPKIPTISNSCFKNVSLK